MEKARTDVCIGKYKYFFFLIFYENSIKHCLKTKIDCAFITQRRKKHGTMAQKIVGRQVELHCCNTWKPYNIN